MFHGSNDHRWAVGLLDSEIMIVPASDVNPTIERNKLVMTARPTKIDNGLGKLFFICFHILDDNFAVSFPWLSFLSSISNLAMMRPTNNSIISRPDMTITQIKKFFLPITKLFTWLIIGEQ